MDEPMTPEQFKEAVQAVITAGGEGDPETSHIATDGLMEQALIELGYHEGVELIRTMTRWHA